MPVLICEVFCVPRAGLTTEVVVARAAQMLDSGSPERLNLAALAEDLGVRPPSLYKHVDGMAGLRRGVMLRAKADIAQVLGQAAIGRARDDAVRRMASAYRRWALEHPAQYLMAMNAPVPGDEDDAQASDAIADVIYDVMSGYQLRGEDVIDATRFLRSALHGFVALEASGCFQLPVDVDRSFARLVGTVVTALSRWAPS